MDVTFAVERYCRGIYNGFRCQMAIPADDTTCPRCIYETPRREFTVTIDPNASLADQFRCLSDEYHERSKDPGLDRIDYEAISFAAVKLLEMSSASRDGKPLRLR